MHLSNFLQAVLRGLLLSTPDNEPQLENMRVFSSLPLATALTAAGSSATATAGSRGDGSRGLVVDSAPTTAQPYVLPNLQGHAVDFGGLIIRTLVPNTTSSGAFSLVGVNAGPGPLNLIHHHKEVEAFYTLKGSVQVFHNTDTGRELRANDFVFLAPGNNHTYRPNDLDFQLTLGMAPGGIDQFFTAAGNSYDSDAPFNPQDTSQLNVTKVLGLMPQYNIVPEPFNSISLDWVNGTTPNGLDTWHVADQSLPDDPNQAYFISSNRGPKYLHRDTDQVTAQLASGKQTNNLLSVATIVMKRHCSQDSIRFDVDQAFQVTEGRLSIEINGERAHLIFGDLVFIPKNTSFRYRSSAGFTKMVVWAAGNGLADHLISQSEPWNYGVWPA
jgi:mannose-6-phosphate isomerase-like protein (cupin superfamily)